MNITYQGVELRVEGSFTKGVINGYSEENIPPQYEVYNVFAEDTDITVLLGLDQIWEIELLILETL